MRASWQAHWRRLGQILLHRGLPFGISRLGRSAGADAAFRAFHQQLPVTAQPGRRWLFRTLNVWLWLRWWLWRAWRHSYSAVKLHAQLAQSLSGLSPIEQGCRVLWLALRYGVPPASWYRFQLWKVPASAVWRYLYDQELPVFHQLYNRLEPERGGSPGPSVLLLADKPRSAEHFAAQGIPTVPSLALLPSGAVQALFDLLAQHPDVFCKPQAGSASKGAMRVRQTANQLSVTPLGQAALRGQDAAQEIRRQLIAVPYLVQPVLENHPLCSDLLTPDRNEVVTVRIMTRWQSGAATLFCVYLEVPLPESLAYQPVAVDMTNGGLLLEDDNWLCHQLKHLQPSLYTRLLAFCLPDWAQLAAMAQRAHALVPDIRVVAWDFVVTPTGPVLLEGNVGWGVTVPQILSGPLLPRWLGIAEGAAGVDAAACVPP